MRESRYRGLQLSCGVFCGGECGKGNQPTNQPKRHSRHGQENSTLVRHSVTIRHLDKIHKPSNNGGEMECANVRRE